MNCQTKLRINHLTAVKSVAILENRNVYPFCATSIDEFVRWNIGKQRASEWRRAGLVRATVLTIIRKNKHSSITEESVWPRHTIMSWCRKNGFVPMMSEKMTLLPEPKWSGVELVSVSIAGDLFSDLKEDRHLKLDFSDEDIEIELVEDTTQEPPSDKKNNNQSQHTNVPYMNPASIFVKETASQIGIDFKPVEIEPSMHVPAIEEMIFAACREFATDILRSSVNAGFNRMGGQLCPEEITSSDIYTAIKDNAEYDFLMNTYLGVPKEANENT
ncbi:YEATS domain-containing protein 2 [Trichonephila clavipes]|nr:YEATS domain-containing protein 2 [Trichonephila clavipes]